MQNEILLVTKPGGRGVAKDGRGFGGDFRKRRAQVNAVRILTTGVGDRPVGCGWGTLGFTPAINE